jgi:predicted amidohydrolase
MKLALAACGVAAPANLKFYLARIDRLAADAARKGAELLVLPEYVSMVLAGADIKTPDIAAELAYVVERAAELIAIFTEIAKRHRLYILAGSLPMRTGNIILNRAPFIAPSGAVAYQDKQSMTRFEAEEWGISGGGGPRVFDTSLGRIGVSICYDSEFPLHVRAQVMAGAKLILIPSCTSTPAGFNRVRLSARARALENQCYTAVAPLVGTAAWAGSIDTNIGHAALFTPCDEGFPDDGVAAAGPLNEPGLTFGEVNFTAIDVVRRDGNVLNHRDWGAAIQPCPVVELV